jgi:hypothetical protein
MHVAGFMAAGPGALVAMLGVAVGARGVAPRTSRASAIVAAVSLLGFALPGSLGWYGFLAAVFGWTVMVAAFASQDGP